MKMGIIIKPRGFHDPPSPLVIVEVHTKMFIPISIKFYNKEGISFRSSNLSVIIYAPTSEFPY